MSKPLNLPDYSDIDITNDLFQQLSVSLDNTNKFLPHKHIVSKPKLKRLLKIKASSSLTNTSGTAFCCRCKKETLLVGHVGESGQQNVAEKEVEVKKDFIVKACEKRVHFVAGDFGTIGETEEKADEKKKVEDISDQVEGDGNSEPQENHDDTVSNPVSEQSESTPAHFQSVFFARRPSIIGNNEFWLPKFSSSDAVKEQGTFLGHVAESSEITPQAPEVIEKKDSKSGRDASMCGNATNVPTDSQLSGLSVFLNNIFKQTAKRQVKILQVATMLDDTLAILTDEYFFKCKSVLNTYEIIDAISLKDVQKIMVSDTCSLLVLEVCHASSLIEFKEFVPGYSEKTESLISLMVYALSRIKNYLLDVTRLPLLSLPTCESMQNWFVRQNEEFIYSGIAAAENISHYDYEDLADESFMMKISGTNQFHPVLLLLRAGYLTSKCNGGCAGKGCKYSVTLGLKKEKVSVMRREDNPWPNCVRLITECMDITFAGSCKASADDLMETLYSCMQPTIVEIPIKFQVFILVTEYSMQLFKLTVDKAPVFGSPLLNLQIFDEDVGGMACIIDSEGIEVDDLDNLQLQNRWRLNFLDEDEKLRFLTATSVE